MLYGKFIPFEDLLAGKVPAPASAEPFLAAVRKYSHEVHERQG